jgi:hypothetical protein
MATTREDKASTSESVTCLSLEKATDLRDLWQQPGRIRLPLQRASLA